MAGSTSTNTTNVAGSKKPVSAPPTRNASQSQQPPRQAPETVDKPKDSCPFCEIIKDSKKAKTKIFETMWDKNFLVMEPQDPVTRNGHILVILHQHVKDTSAFGTFGNASAVAAQVARKIYPNNPNFSIITSNGDYPKVLMPHLCVHIVMRAKDDGLKLPWTEQLEKKKQAELKKQKEMEQAELHKQNVKV